MKKYAAFLLMLLLTNQCYSITKGDIKDTIDCISALSMMKSTLEDSNNYKAVKITKQLIEASQNKMQDQLSVYIKEKLSNNQNAILDIQEMTKESFNVYKFKNPLEQARFSKQVIDTNNCIQIEKKYFSN